jgi:hypothetical protein
MSRSSSTIAYRAREIFPNNQGDTEVALAWPCLNFSSAEAVGLGMVVIFTNAHLLFVVQILDRLAPCCSH